MVRKGRYGEFVGCSGYPECKYIRRDNQQAEAKPTGEKCPECKEGDLVERQGRYGPFVACNRYPECKYRANQRGAAAGGGAARPAATVLNEPCPLCGKPLVERKGRYGSFKSCSDYPRCAGPKGVAGGREKSGAGGKEKGGTGGRAKPGRARTGAGR